MRGAREHNLKDVDAHIPLGVFTAVTGVSGAGKSSLVNGILHPALRRALYDSIDVPGAFDAIPAKFRGSLWAKFSPSLNSTRS